MKVAVKTGGAVGVRVAGQQSRYGVSVANASQAVQTYTGKYVVVPKAKASQTLLTSGKKMSRNVTVTEIPYFETSNESGGKTVFIGG